MLVQVLIMMKAEVLALDHLHEQQPAFVNRRAQLLLWDLSLVGELEIKTSYLACLGEVGQELVVETLIERVEGDVLQRKHQVRDQSQVLEVALAGVWVEGFFREHLVELYGDPLGERLSQSAELAV